MMGLLEWGWKMSIQALQNELANWKARALKAEGLLAKKTTKKKAASKK
jgi:hypothetical protein